MTRFGDKSGSGASLSRHSCHSQHSHHSLDRSLHSVKNSNEILSNTLAHDENEANKINGIEMTAENQPLIAVSEENAKDV